MRILIVHNTLNDSTSVSGVLRHYAWMANEWSAAGHPTDFVLAKAGWPQLRALAPGARLLSSDGIFNATRYLSQTWRYFPAYGYRMATAHWLRLPQRYDLVYASTQLIVEVYAAMILARRLRVPWVVKVHHVLAAQKQRQGFFDGLFLWSERKTTRWIHCGAQLIICGTDLVAQDFHALEEALGLTRSKTVQIGYGIDLAAMPVREAEKKYDAVVLGRMHEHKGIFDLPWIWKEIIGRFPRARLLVIGEGPHRERCQQMFEELELSGSVTFTGGIGEQEKNRLLLQCRVGLSLSYEEGWGLSINEFLAAALPVVAYGLPIFDLVFPEKLVTVATGDRRAFAEKLAELMANPDRQRALGAAGRQFVERYDFRVVAKAELDAVKQAIH